MKRWTRFLLIAATVLAGFLAGGDLDRAVVAMPAWQHVGAIGWAAFSRNADLGNGLFLYPFEAIAGALLILGAIATFYVGQIRQRRTLLLLYAGLICSVGGLLFTIKPPRSCSESLISAILMHCRKHSMAFFLGQSP